MNKVEVWAFGNSGGLHLFWRSPVVMQLKGKTKNFIDVSVGSGSDDEWRFTGFYGEPRWEEALVVGIYAGIVSARSPPLGCHWRF